jgi:hypothetical protein
LNHRHVDLQSFFGGLRAYKSITYSACRPIFPGPPWHLRRIPECHPRDRLSILGYKAVLHHQNFVLPGDPNAHSPIHSDDMILHIEPFLEAAVIGGNIVNWGGDEVVTSQQTLARIAERTGIPAKVVVQTKDGGAMGNASHAARRRSITGPCTIDFWSGFERLLDEMIPSSATSQSETHSNV